MISEKAMINLIKGAKKILLIEPRYTHKYIPLGLAKIATFAKNNGAEVVYKRFYEPSNEDLICVTSMFTYESDKVHDVLREVYRSMFRSDAPLLIGGIYASLMPNHIAQKYPKANIFKGYSKILDACPPDYSVDWGVDQEWQDCSYVFTTRGCPNRCPYCTVWRIEPDAWTNSTWQSHIMDKEKVVIFDNNLSAQSSSHIKKVCHYLTENDKLTTFDNGFDCKYITDELAAMLAKIRFAPHGLRLAFDRIEDDGVFQKAIIKLKNAGIDESALMAYVLFNFQDKPQEAEYRMQECIKLGVRPYPQQYKPLNKIKTLPVYIGKYWTNKLVWTFRQFYYRRFYTTETKTFESFIEECVKRDMPAYRLTDKDWQHWNA